MLKKTHVAIEGYCVTFEWPGPSLFLRGKTQRAVESVLNDYLSDIRCSNALRCFYANKDN